MFGAAELARANGNIMTVGLFARRWDGTGVLKKAFYKGSAAYWEIRTAFHQKNHLDHICDNIAHDFLSGLSNCFLKEIKKFRISYLI